MLKEPDYGNVPGEYPARRDTERHDVQEHVYLTTYWKKLPNGKGPAVSLFVHGDEVLKFDCFGAGKGHYHIGLDRPKRPCSERLYFADETVERQIARTVFELTVNLQYYLDRHPDTRVRTIDLDATKLEAAVEEVRRRMLELQKSIPELRNNDE